jgi:uncharacterized protein (DUF1330 family)
MMPKNIAVQFSLAVHDGRPVVLEQRPKLPLIIHTFDSAAAALMFYERGADEPFTPQRRAELAARVKLLAGTSAPEGVR